MSAAEMSGEGFEWDDPQLRRGRLVEEWSDKSEDFDRQVVRPRPSRVLKYLGVAIGLTGIAWFFGLGFAVDHFWPGYLESTHVVWWQVPIGMVVLFAPYLTLTIGGLWLWGKGRDRRK
jgi:hypothetical protein